MTRVDETLMLSQGKGTRFGTYYNDVVLPIMLRVDCDNAARLHTQLTSS